METMEVMEVMEVSDQVRLMCQLYFVCCVLNF
uniref:Uncharacterized protein n=1 Tax=Anguilla anguilla TaxID=7936 RepID=A0A0E9W914_ANGAN